MIEILLPSAILLLAFLLKLFINRSVKAPDVIKSILELPVDIVFLALSLIAATIISGQLEVEVGLVLFICYIVGAVFVVIMWRNSEKLFEADRHMTMICAFGFSLLLCVTCLYYAVVTLSGANQ